MSFSGDLYPTAGASAVMNSKGDIVRYDSARERYGIGSTNQVLSVTAGLPTWKTLTTADSVLTTQGDVLYESASGLARLGFGTSGDVLTTKGTGANPVWETPSAGGKWEKIDYTELTGSATGTLDTSTFALRDFLKVFMWNPASGGTRATVMRLGTGGSIDTNSNYNYTRWSGGVYETGTSQNNLILNPATTVNSDFYSVIDIINLDGQEKSWVANTTVQDYTASASGGGGWSNTNQLNIIQMNSALHGGTDANVSTGAFIEVWGSNADA